MSASKGVRGTADIDRSRWRFQKTTIRMEQRLAKCIGILFGCNSDAFSLLEFGVDWHVDLTTFSSGESTVNLRFKSTLLTAG